jgi:hypothetical protein
MWQRLPGRPDAEHETLQRVISLSGNEKTVRGLASVDLIIIDEAARVDDELLAATRPMGRGARARFPERRGPGPYFTPSATSSPLPARF